MGGCRRRGSGGCRIEPAVSCHLSPELTCSLPINCSGLSSRGLPPLPLDPALSPPVLLTHSWALEAPFCPPVLCSQTSHNPQNRETNPTPCPTLSLPPPHPCLSFLTQPLLRHRMRKRRLRGNSHSHAPVLRAGSTRDGEMSGDEELVTTLSQQG